MGAKEVFNYIKERVFNRPVEVYDDNETRDKYLRSLRRERRIQLEQDEKKRLMAQIKAYNQLQRRKNLYGIGNNILKEKNKFKPQKKTKWF